MPRQAATTGVAALAVITARATSPSGGLETSRITSVAGSASSAATASRAISPPTSADRSRPPTPITCETPMPHRSSKVMASCAPVPAAATIPTGPAPTALAKPRPVPPSTAVPAPGPMTSRPSRLARPLSSTSAASDTLSLNRRTCRPAVRAAWAAIAAYGPGTEMTATFACGSRAAASLIVRGSGRRRSSPGWASSAKRAARPRDKASSAASASAAQTASTSALASAPARSPGGNPRPVRSSTVAGVAIAALAQLTPAESSIARVALSSRSESRYEPGNTRTALVLTGTSIPARSGMGCARCGCPTAAGQHRRQQAGRGDHGQFPAARQEAQRRLDLGAHAAGRELAIVEVAGRLGGGDRAQFALLRRAVVEHDPVHGGDQEQRLSPEQPGDETSGVVLVDDRVHDGTARTGVRDRAPAPAGGDHQVSRAHQRAQCVDLDDAGRLG